MEPIRHEQAAREAITGAVRDRRWSLSQCVERLAAVGYTSSVTAVHRFLKEPTRRLGLDEFMAWSLALSLNPADVLSIGEPIDEPELSRELRRQADRYVGASWDVRLRIESELIGFVNDQQLLELDSIKTEFRKGQALARKRHGKAQQN